MPANRRVVVTGMGAVTSIGIGKADFWRNLIAGKSGIGDVENHKKYLHYSFCVLKKFVFMPR